MNYLRVYCALVKNAERREPPSEYTENHHIFPKSMFGENKRIVALTAREHFVAHLLLEKGLYQRYKNHNHPNVKKARWAIMCMGWQHKEKRYVNSRLYSEAKNRFSRAVSGENHWCWKPQLLSEQQVSVVKWYHSRRKEYKDVTRRKLAFYFGVRISDIDKALRSNMPEKLYEEYNYLPLLIRLKVRGTGFSFDCADFTTSQKP